MWVLQISLTPHDDGHRIMKKSYEGNSMTSRHRFLISLAVCLSGLLLMPAVPFATDVIEWEMFAGIYIHDDDFESGNTLEWSITVSGNRRVLTFKPGSLQAAKIFSSVDVFGYCLIPDRMLGVKTSDGMVLGHDCKIEIGPKKVGINFSLVPVLEKIEQSEP